MNTDKKDYDSNLGEINDLTNTIIGCAFEVSNELGCGFLEKVYENALAHELRKRAIAIEQQSRIPVYYDGVIVGEYCADLVVLKKVLVEIKASKGIDEKHYAQCLNYLKATGLSICLLLNFGESRVQIKRIAN